MYIDKITKPIFLAFYLPQSLATYKDYKITALHSQISNIAAPKASSNSKIPISKMVLQALQSCTSRWLAKNHVIAIFWECSIAKVETQKVMLLILIHSSERFMRIWQLFKPRNTFINLVIFLSRIFHPSEKGYRQSHPFKML